MTLAFTIQNWYCSFSTNFDLAKLVNMFCFFDQNLWVKELAISCFKLLEYVKAQGFFKSQKVSLSQEISFGYIKKLYHQGQHFNPPKFRVASVVSIATLFELQLQPLYFDNVITNRLSSHTRLELQFADHTACKMYCNQYYFSSTLMPQKGTHISKNL
jgi:hypothetical protein